MHTASHQYQESDVKQDDVAQYTRAASSTESLGEWRLSYGHTLTTDPSLSTPNECTTFTHDANTTKQSQDTRDRAPLPSGSVAEAKPRSQKGTSKSYTPSVSSPNFQSTGPMIGALPYPNMADAYYGPYSQPTRPADPTHFPRYYYYGYVPQDAAMGYARPFPTDPAAYPQNGDEKPQEKDPSAPQRPMAMPMPYPMPLYQRPVYYPNASVMSAFPYPTPISPPVPDEVSPDPGFTTTQPPPIPHAGHQYATMYESHPQSKHLYLNPAGGFPGNLPTPAYGPFMYGDGGAQYYGYPPSAVMHSSMLGQYPMVHGYPTAPVDNAPVSSDTRLRRSMGNNGPSRGRRSSNRQNSKSPHPQHEAASEQPSSSKSSPASEEKPDDTLRPPAFNGNGDASSSPPSREDSSPKSNDVVPETPSGAVSEDQRLGKRSNFVMWCGNVPSDSTLDELWRFFGSIPSDFTVPSSADSDTPGQTSTESEHKEGQQGLSLEESGRQAGILSIFIMSRSSCAFVNYVTGADLDRACAYFHGKPLRLKPSCPRLVCRPRRLEDAEYAGVAAQRGKGVHTNWYRQQRQQQRQSQELDDADDVVSPLDAKNNETQQDGTSDSRSFASTNSSLLRQPMFAHRLFILKSRNTEALATALRTNVWCTQPHNEPVLDQAFRNSSVVTLLFSENFSGQFFGYATMSSRIGGALPGATTPPPLTAFDETQKTLEETRPLVDEPLSKDTGAAVSTSGHEQESNAMHLHNGIPTFFTRSPPKAENTASTETTNTTGGPDTKEDRASTSSVSSNSATSSMHTECEANDELASNAKIHNRRLDMLDTHLAADESVEPQETPEKASSTFYVPNEKPTNKDHKDTYISAHSAASDPIHDSKSQLGQPFYISWKNTKPLPFSEIQSLRNPWRDNRLVKVSRDGTELEPKVGKQLLAIWDAYAKNSQ